MSEPTTTVYVVWCISDGDVLFKKSIDGSNKLTPPNGINLNSDLHGETSYLRMIAAR